MNGTVEPMLCEYSTVEALPDIPLYCQPKLNGVRAWWSVARRALIMRGGFPITSCPQITQDCAAFELPLDGEIYRHGAPIGDIAGAVRRLRPSDFSVTLEFCCFDMWNREPQHKRLIADNRWLPASMHVRHVPTVLTKTNTERRALYSEYLSAGYEGMIARLPDARYAPGKRILWKIKPLWD